ncbi:MAG: type II secretion system F family protein [Vulcanimicrobiota bacterium]
MKRFRYTALTSRGETIIRDVEAPDEGSAIAALQKEKLKLLNIKAVACTEDNPNPSFILRFRDSLFSFIFDKNQNGLHNPALPWNRVSERCIFLFTHQLATLLGAGVNVSSGMRMILKSETDRNFIPILQGLVESMEKGISVQNSFKKYPNVFSMAYSGIIAVGESSGKLPFILEKQARDLEKLYTFKKKLIASLTYPATILVFSILSVLLMMVYFVPNFSSIYKETQSKLPLITTILIGFVNYLTDPFFWITVIAASAIMYFIVGSYLRTPVGRHTIDYLALKIPVIGELVSWNILYSVFMNLACMMECGIHICKSLEIIKDMMHNTVFKDYLVSILMSLDEGFSLHDSVREIPLFPRFAKDFIQAGESSGELPKLIRKAAFMLEEQINDKLDTFLHIFEPVLIAVLAIIVGAIMIAIFLPINNVINSFSI